MSIFSKFSNFIFNRKILKAGKDKYFNKPSFVYLSEDERKKIVDNAINNINGDEFNNKPTINSVRVMTTSVLEPERKNEFENFVNAYFAKESGQDVLTSDLKVSIADTLKTKYLGRYVVYASLEDTQPLYEKYKNSEENKSMFEEYVNQEGIVEHRMRLDAYQELAKKDIEASNLSRIENIRNFFSNIKNNVNQEIMNNTDQSTIDQSVWAFNQFISDYTDSYKIADTFAEKNSELEKYSKYADVPVPVIALHSIFAKGSIQLNKDGSVNRQSFKNLVNNLGDDKMVEFASELCGLQLDDQGRVQRKSTFDNQERAEYLHSLLPVAVKHFNQYAKEYTFDAILTNQKLQEEQSKIDDKCSKDINTLLSNKEQLLDYVVDNVNKDVDAIVSTVTNKKLFELESKRIASSVSRIVDLVTSDVNQNAKDIPQRYTDLHKALVDVYVNSPYYNDLGKDNVYSKQDATFIQNLLPKAKEYKTPNIAKTYSSLVKILSDNLYTIDYLKKEALANKSLSQRNIGEAVLTDEDFERSGIKQVVNFSKSITDLIIMKERAKQLSQTIGQVKYESLLVSDAITQNEVSKISSQRNKILVDKNDQLTNINGELNKFRQYIDTLYNNKRIKISAYYSSRFSDSIWAYVNSRIGADIKNDPKLAQTIEKGIAQSRKVIEKTKMKVEVDNNQNLIEAFTNEFLRIANAVGKYQFKESLDNKKISKQELFDRIRKELLRVDITNNNATVPNGYILTSLDTIEKELQSTQSIISTPLQFGERDEYNEIEKSKNILKEIKQIDSNINKYKKDLNVKTDNRTELLNEINDFDKETRGIISARKREINEVNGLAIKSAIELEYQQTRDRIKEAENALNALRSNLSLDPSNLPDEQKQAYNSECTATINEYKTIIEDSKNRLKGIVSQATKLGLVQSVDQENGNVMFVPKTPENEAVEKTTETKETEAQTSQEEETQAEQTNGQTQVISKELQDEAERFVTAYVTASALNAVYNDPRSEEAQKVMSKIDYAKLYPNRENGYEAGRESATKVIEDCNDIMENIARNKQPVGPEDDKAFIDAVATEYVEQQKQGLKQNKNADPSKMLTFEEAKKKFGAELARLQGRKVEATDTQNLDANTNNVATENPDAQATENKDGARKAPKSKKPVKIEYTIKGCELALKSINKMLAKLEEQIKKDKALAAEAKARAAALEKQTAQSQATQTQNNESTLDSKSKPVDKEQTETAADLGDSSLEAGDDISDLFNKETPEDNQTKNNATEVEVTPNTPAKAAAKQVYLTMVYEEMAKTLKGMDNISAAELMKSLDISIDGMDFANSTPEQIVEALEQRGISLDTQNRAFSLQLSTIKNAQVNEEGHLVNAKGQDVETKLYERFDDAEEAISTGISSGKKGQTTVRNLILYAIGKDLIEREKVEEESNEIVKELEEQGIEATPEQIRKVLSGELKLADGTPVVDVDKVRAKINKKLESKVPRKDMGTK